jgi:ubiquinone/menaquinone biosynthesis C-methylase UbiE
MDFKQKAPFLNDDEYKQYYANLSGKHIQRETDLSRSSLEAVLMNVVGDRVLDIACGKGFLCFEIAKKCNVAVHGVDISLPASCVSSSNPSFSVGRIEEIDFPDEFFDTVVCTHTIEHIVNIQKAISELRRVVKRRLIIVVPKQREYKYTFDLHVNFFPYEHSLMKVMRNPDAKCYSVSNDLIYIEDVAR